MTHSRRIPYVRMCVNVKCDWVKTINTICDMSARAPIIEKEMSHELYMWPYLLTPKDVGSHSLFIFMYCEHCCVTTVHRRHCPVWQEQLDGFRIFVFDFTLIDFIFYLYYYSQTIWNKAVKKLLQFLLTLWRAAIVQWPSDAVVWYCEKVKRKLTLVRWTTRLGAWWSFRRESKKKSVRCKKKCM